MKFFLGIIIVLMGSLFIPSCFGFEAELDKIVYVTNNTIQLTGTTDSDDAFVINATIYDNTDTELYTTGTISTSGSFTLTAPLTDYVSGEYYAVITKNQSNPLTLYFHVVDEEINYRIYIVQSNDIYIINTANTISSGNSLADIYSSSAYSLSDSVRYGNNTIDGDRYHFVLSDPNVNNSYNRLFIDNDPDFLLYNSTEDSIDGTGIIEKEFKKKDIWSKNNTNYIIAGIDYSGSKIILGKPFNTSKFSSGQTAYYLILSEDASGNIVGNKTLDIAILNPNQGSVANITTTTNDSGIYVGSVVLSSVGTYTIIVNNGATSESLDVESFKINAKTTDLSGEPTGSFTPGSTVKVNVIAKDNSGLINLTSISLEIIYPNGTAITVSMTESSLGNYYYELLTASSLQGSYGLKITAVNGTSQILHLGFLVESTSFDMFAINTAYLDEVEDGGIFVDSFAPGNNITIMAIQSNISQGGFMGGKDGGAVPIEDTITNVTCGDVVSVIELKDDKENIYDISSTLMIRSIENMTEVGGILEGANPPEGMMQQCMIIITNNSLPDGFYSLKAKLTINNNQKFSGSSFGIQRLRASGYTVDKNAENFGFFAPNSTVNLKVKLVDMTTDQEINASQIIDAKIVEMQRQWPEFTDVLSQSSNEQYNSATGTLSFTSPTSEGFYSLKFRFKANITDNVSGNLESRIYEGLGEGFFELKKYIIFAQIASSGNEMSMGKAGSFKKPGDNITLTVSVVDIDKGSLFDIGFDMNSGSQMSCTGCSGLIARITKVVNQQLFREIDPDEYTAIEGTIQNTTSGASVMITNQNLDSGFYGVELELVNPEDETETYFGWGNFEIRSFFVDNTQAFYPYDNGTEYPYFYSETSNQGMGMMESVMEVETGSPVYIKTEAKMPGMNGGISLPITNAEIVNILQDNGGEDFELVSICQGDECGTLINRTYLDQEYNCTYMNGQQECSTQLTYAWIANITLPEEDNSEFIVNIRVTSGDNSDIGTIRVSTASFLLDTSYRDSQGWWDPLYSSDELLNITLVATNFSGDGARTLDTASVDFIFDDKKGRPVRITPQIWNASSMRSCLENVCNVWINLSSFEAGRYILEVIVNDTAGLEQTSSEIRFEIKNTLFSIPQILESWNWQSDSADTGSITLNDQQDRCDNDNLEFRGATNDNNLNQELTNNYLGVESKEDNISIVYLPDNCPAEEDRICPGSDPFNFTNIPNINKTEMNYVARLVCLNESSGQVQTYNTCDPESAFIALVSNATVAWIKYNVTLEEGNYSMENSTMVNGTGDVVLIGSREWTTQDIKIGGGDGSFSYLDSQLIKLLGYNSLYVRVNSKPSQYTIGHFCADASGNIDSNPRTNNCGFDETDLFIMMNYTHALISSTSDLTGTWITKGISSNTNNEFAIASVGYDSTGDLANKTRVIRASNYGIFIPQENNLGTPNYTIIPDYYPNMWGGIFCIGNDSSNGQGPGVMARQWRNKNNVNMGGDDCGENAERIFVYTNTTHVWLSANNNLTSVTPMTLTANNVTFEEIVGLNWSLASLNVSNGRSIFRMKLSENRMCGQSWASCQGQGPCQPEMYTIYAPGEYSEFAFGQVNLIQNPWMVTGMFNGAPSERYVYVFHNKTHAFMTDENKDFRDVIGISIGNNITDPYSGLWNVKSLSDNTISLKGLNTVAGSGAYINMSLSRSGTVRMGILREQELGFFQSGERSGMDLNGNDLTNDTVYYVLSDANTAGVYDTFFFSGDSTSLNFSNPISVNDNQTTRTFVNSGDIQLTLLSIDPRATKVLFYTSELGDWSELGDIAVNSNIRIPLIIKKPNGGAVEATVKGIGAYKIDESTGVKTYIAFNEVSFSANTGIGEIILNSSEDNTNYAFTSGQYLFEVSGNTSNDEFKLEEWKWPRANLRPFLTSDVMGKGGWINGFYNITRNVYGGMSNSRFLELYSVNLSNGYNAQGYFNGVADTAWNFNSTDCTFVQPVDANPTSAAEIHESQQWNIAGYYFYFSGNSTESDRVWIKQDDCNFTEASYYTVGQFINITQDTGTYMLQLLAMQMRNETNNLNSYAIIGINISNTTLMKPLSVDQFDSGGRWKLASMNISGTILNAILTNSSSHQMCSVYFGECLNAIFISTDGEYNALGVGDILTAGDNLSSVGLGDYYISTLGPNSWEGIIISDGSQIPVGIPKPVFGNLYIRDPTPLIFKLVNESNTSIDLNLDDDLNDIFYIVAFDDLQDGQQIVTRIIIDDDSEITPMWQGAGQSTEYYDYSGNESGTMIEQWGNVPNAIWNGNLNFGPEEENRNNNTYRDIPWEQKPSWNILFFDNNDMLINKDQWCGIGENDTLKLIVRAYHFNQSNIAEANVSISKVYKFNFAGGGIYNSSYYTATSAVTQSNGYAVVSISPSEGNSWDTNSGFGSNYIFRILIDSGGNTATTERFTLIGGACQWNN